MIKPLFVAATVLGLANACQNAVAADGYEIAGQLKNAPAGTTVRLSELANNQFVEKTQVKTDAAGKFAFKGTAPTSGIYQVKLDDNNQVLVLLDNKTRVMLAGDAKNLPGTYTATGSKDAEMLQQLTRVLYGSKAEMESLGQRYQAADQAGKQEEMQAIQAQYNAVQGGTNARVKSIIRRNGRSVAAGFAAGAFINPEEEFAFADSIAGQQRKANPASPYTLQLVSRLDAVRATAPGALATDINAAMPDGKMLALSSLRGKYVLLDFWASWCGPCAMEAPVIDRVARRYEKRGLVVMGVNVDDGAEVIKAYASQKGLSYPMVMDIGKQASLKYSVDKLPSLVVIDRQGNVLAFVTGMIDEASLNEILTAAM